MAGASRFTNRDRLMRVLGRIPSEVKRALEAQNAKNAMELVATMKGFAPKDDRVLEQSIEARDASDGSRISQEITAGGKSTTKSVRSGASATYDYSLAQEFGTPGHPASPFFWPAWRLKRRAFKSRMSRAAKKAIEGAVK